MPLPPSVLKTTSPDPSSPHPESSDPSRSEVPQWWPVGQPAVVLLHCPAALAGHEPLPVSPGGRRITSRPSHTAHATPARMKNTIWLSPSSTTLCTVLNIHSPRIPAVSSNAPPTSISNYRRCRMTSWINRKANRTPFRERQTQYCYMRFACCSSAVLNPSWSWNLTTSLSLGVAKYHKLSHCLLQYTAASPPTL